MRSIILVTAVVSYDLVEEDVPTEALEQCFRVPEVVWDRDSLGPGEIEAISKAVIRKVETRTIEIDREDCIVWVTSIAVVEIEYDTELLSYYGVSLEEAAENACVITFPSEDRHVVYVSQEITVSVN